VLLSRGGEEESVCGAGEEKREREQRNEWLEKKIQKSESLTNCRSRARPSTIFFLFEVLRIPNLASSDLFRHASSSSHIAPELSFSPALVQDREQSTLSATA
jgi:hypothetical protein